MLNQIVTHDLYVFGYTMCNLWICPDMGRGKENQPLKKQSSQRGFVLSLCPLHTPWFFGLFQKTYQNLYLNPDI